jgi:hypothetical protein
MNRHEQRADIVARYRSGQTIMEIGAVYGVTKQAVHQTLKHQGVTSKEGGKRARCARAAQLKAGALAIAAAARREAEALRYYGVPFMVLESITAQDPSIRKAYVAQRNNARSRGVDWSFNIETWWLVWNLSGKWGERGRLGYVMARHGDTGAYAPHNVYICTAKQNASDSYIWKPAHVRKKPLTHKKKSG